MAGTQGKRRIWLRWVLLGLAVLVVVPVAGVAVLLATLDLNAQKPRIAAAVRQATGRELTLAGPISLKPSLVPTLAVEQVALANLPGGSRPQMLEVRQAELELALLPLLSRRVEVRRLVLVGPDIVLETDKDGRPNWAFAPEGGAPAAPPGQVTVPAEPGGGPGFQVSVQRVAITEGRLTWRDGASGQSRVLAIPRFEASAQGGPIGFGGELALDGTAFRLSGETGPMEALFGAPAATPPGTPWPVKLALDAAGARLAVDGSLAEPLAGRGWRGAISAQVPVLEALAPLLPGVTLPPLHGIDLAANVAEAAGAPGGLPTISGLRLTVGESALDPLFPGLKLAAASLALPQPDQNGQVELRGSLGALPFTLAGTLGAPAPLLAGRPGPWPLDLTLTAANAEARIQGAIAELAKLAGVDLALSLKVPDLGPFAALAGTPLPPVTNIALQARLAERDPGFANGAVLRGLHLTSSAFDAAGDLTVQRAPRPGVQGSLASSRIDLDALRPPPSPAQPGAAAPAPPRPAAADGRVIPDLPLKLDALRGFDAGLRWEIGELHTGGVAIRQVQLVLQAEAGRAQLHLPGATLPGGQLAARLNADVTQDPPRLAGAVYSEGLDLPPLLAALGAPAGTAGRLEMDIDLAGRGRDLRAVAGSADGRIALALTSGHVEQGSGSALARAIGELRQAVPQMAGIAQGRIEIACAAARFAVQEGVAHSQALLVDGSLGKVGGGGTANLRDETLALRLELDLALPIPGVNLVRIRAPVPVTGRFAAPRLDYGAAAGSGVLGTAEGLLRTPSNLADGLLGALGGPRGAVPGAGGNLPECGPALATVRGGRAGPVPQSAAPRAPASPAAPGTSPQTGQRPGQDQGEAAQQLLRGLFGR
ncbi:AsmA family protein [Siccirubricoccus phaeus]|uniref:AsmA family protein n=1 Tax=Siccirubricoccus phaeus TaxID=2595053 RepID=UPI00165B95FD|nr:AsmA family protein [Siccirubricoccus phaeus]